MGQEPDELQIDDDDRFARREAFGERVGWAIMAAVVVAAVLGLFADGPMSYRSVESDNLRVRYQRFGRNEARTSLEVEAQPAAATQGNVEVWVSQEFLETYELEDVRPEPESTSTRAGGVVFAFAVEGTDTPVKATLRMRPEQTGRHRGAVAVGGGRPATVTQFVYP